MKRRITTKTALAFSMLMFAVWIMLGANATLAWFSDTTDTAKNTFIIGDLNLDVSYKNGFVTTYMPMTEGSKVFNENALYEPGYTQVVWLKIENKGNVDFNYKVAVNVADYTMSVNKYGMPFCLPPHLRFGVLFGASEIELERQLAQSGADQNMGNYTFNTYSKVDDDAVVRANETRYAAVVVYMPETVGNEANYAKGEKVPQVDLGMTVFAQQAGTPLN